MLTIILETISGAMNSTAFWDICYLSIAFFGLELILRIIFCQSAFKFFVDPLQLIDFVVITQDIIFTILISTTSTTTVIGNGNNNNNGGNSGSSSSNSSGTGPAPPGGGPVPGGVSLSSSTSQTIQKVTKITRFLYVLKIFRYFSSLKILALALARGWKAMGNAITIQNGESRKLFYLIQQERKIITDQNLTANAHLKGQFPYRP